MKHLHLGVTTKVWVLLAVGLSLAKLDGMLKADWFWATAAPLVGALGSVLIATYNHNSHEEPK